MRAVWAVVKSVTKGIWLRNGDDMRWKAGQFGGGALVERPPTIQHRGAVSWGEGEEVTLDVPLTEMLGGMLPLIEFHLAWATVSLGRRMEG